MKFSSPTMAKRAAARRAGREAYKCPKCRGWHVGRRQFGSRR